MIHRFMNGYLAVTLLLTATTAIGSSVADEPEGQASFALTSPSYTAVAAGEFHTLALRSDGIVYAAGSNSSGQLGDGTTAWTLAGPPTMVSGLSHVTAVAAGCHHSMALTSTGQVWAWGNNSQGQLGASITTIPRTTPQQVKMLPAIKAIAAGCFHSIALDTKGYLWIWGSNSYGQLGTGSPIRNSSTPLQLTSFQASEMDGGDDFTLALLLDGTVRAWGNNNQGQLATGSTSPTSSNSPVLTRLAGISAIAAGASHGLGVKWDGTVVAWGANSFCALGVGTSSPSFSATPLTVNGVSIPGPAISAGRYFSVSADDNGFGPPNPGSVVAVWGGNFSGELGIGSLMYSCRATTGGQYPGYPASWPVYLPRGDRGSLSAGGHHTVAVDVTGKVVAWGKNDAGQLGTGSSSGSVWAMQTMFP